MEDGKVLVRVKAIPPRYDSGRKRAIDSARDGVGRVNCRMIGARRIRGVFFPVPCEYTSSVPGEVKFVGHKISFEVFAWFYRIGPGLDVDFPVEPVPIESDDYIRLHCVFVGELIAYVEGYGIELHFAQVVGQFPFVGIAEVFLELLADLVVNLVGVGCFGGPVFVVGGLDCSGWEPSLSGLGCELLEDLENFACIEVSICKSSSG